MILANRIRQIREAHKLSQAEIAYKVGITPSAYGQIERKAANTKFETLQKIAAAMEVSILFLIDVDNPSYMEEKNKL